MLHIGRDYSGVTPANLLAASMAFVNHLDGPGID